MQHTNSFVKSTYQTNPTPEPGQQPHTLTLKVMRLKKVLNNPLPTLVIEKDDFLSSIPSSQKTLFPEKSIYQKGDGLIMDSYGQSEIWRYLRWGKFKMLCWNSQ